MLAPPSPCCRYPSQCSSMRSTCQMQHSRASQQPCRSAGQRISRAALTVTCTMAPERPFATSQVSSGDPSTSQSRAPAGLHGRAVEEYAMRQCIEQHQRYPRGLPVPAMRWSGNVLEDAYVRCGEVTSEYAKTFYLGTQLMTPQQAKAIWAIYVWCRRTDELVDGPNASQITPQALDQWERRLEMAFEGRPYDVLDAALTDTITQFPLHIQPFRDMIEGMRMDLTKQRYDTFDELYEYCYRVAGTVGLMSMPVMGIDPSYKGPMDRVYKAALALGTANQLTNILRDVGEDIRERNRIYVPMQELAQFNITEEEVLAGMHSPSSGRIDERWRQFMKFQIARAHECFADAEAGVDLLDAKARWPVWSALILYRQILDAIEANDYDNFTKRAYVPKWRKFALLPVAAAKAAMPSIKNAMGQRMA